MICNGGRPATPTARPLNWIRSNRMGSSIVKRMVDIPSLVFVMVEVSIVVVAVVDRELLRSSIEQFDSSAGAVKGGSKVTSNIVICNA